MSKPRVARVLVATLFAISTLAAVAALDVRAEVRATAPAVATVPADPPLGRPLAVVDLASDEGARLVRGTWRYRDVKLVEIDAKGPGPDLKPSGAPVRAYDIAPAAGSAAFDDTPWDAIPASSLDARRGKGKVSFAWYRLKLTVPERFGTVDARGATLVFEVVVDDYAEVWVDGKLAPVLGETGGTVARGFNTPNRVVLTRDARPGQQFQLAVFGMNGPVSKSPDNFIWIKSATLDVHAPLAGVPGEATKATVRRLDPALDEIVPQGATIERVATGFQFTEGPVWVRDSGSGYLLFSDPNANTIYRYTPDGRVSVFRPKSGYRGLDIGEYGQPGSNGLTLDAQGRLTIDEHGNRRVTRLEKNGQVSVLADRYDGKRLNSPNDLVYRSDGTLYFTDPPFGLPKVFDDPRKELPFSGVYFVKDGRVTLAATDLTGPNGIAFSPDEKYLYVSNWDTAKKVVMRYEVRPDGTLAGGRVFFDMTDAPGEEALDGLKVDQRGNVYASGPGGVWIISPHGRHLGTIVAPELPANFAWGDEDGRTLYMTARTSVYRMRLSVAGVRP